MTVIRGLAPPHDTLVTLDTKQLDRTPQHLPGVTARRWTTRVFQLVED
jgi:hypothetical protein